MGTKTWEEVSTEHRRIQGDGSKATKPGITQKTFSSRQTGSLAWPALRILPVYACYQTEAHYALEAV